MKGLRTKVSAALTFLAGLFYMITQGTQMSPDEMAGATDYIGRMLDHWEGALAMAYGVWQWVLRNWTDGPARKVLGL